MPGEIIRQGDPTSHGGTVLEGSLTDICHGKPIAHVGHRVQCPKCKGIFPIIEGVLTTTFYGKGVAIAGMKTACGASLIATQFTDIVEYGGGSTPAAVTDYLKTGAAAPARANAPPADAQASGSEAKPAKSIKRMFWTYGPSEIPVDGVSRHYVDLNLHIDTEHFAAGETADIVIRNDDGSELLDGVATLQVQAIIGADGKGKLMNVFGNRSVKIGTLE